MVIVKGFVDFVLNSKKKLQLWAARVGKNFCWKTRRKLIWKLPQPLES